MIRTDTSDICQQMDQVRCSLGDEVEELVDSAKTLSDWRYYVRNYPWICLAGAGAAGFLVVPQRIAILSASVNTVEELARRNKLVVESNPQPHARSGMGGALLSVLANAAVRAAVGYLAQNTGTLFAQRADATEEHHAEPNR